MDAIPINILALFASYKFCEIIIPQSAGKFIENGLVGKDLHKRNQPKIAESMGTVVLFVYIITLILLMPFELSIEHSFMRYLAAILSIQSMGFLGFVDDVLELKWRHKLFMPLFASLPLIMIYYLQSNVTFINIPFYGLFNLGIFYYVYMVLFAIFCTNSINILAGINGLEVSQSLIISFFTLAYSSIQVYYHNMTSQNQILISNHLFTIGIIAPFIGVSAALLKFNKYPAKVFVGDSYTYTSGMVFAICGILSHTSKTLILFFIPQILNFLVSLPQLARLIPCPKHRLPIYDPDLNIMYYGHVNKDKSMRMENRKHSILEFVQQLKTENPCHMNMINIVLYLQGPMGEDELLKQICKIQLVCNLVGLMCRYAVGQLLKELH
eukprot:NODE_814_length_3983_cov_0.318229.p2 type:complete len:382 gc:universal NODE_814_length_3983_cov_0.318229:3181-2036(-)